MLQHIFVWFNNHSLSWIIYIYIFLLEAYSIFCCLLCCLNFRASCLSALLMHCGCTCLAAYNHLWQCTHFISATRMMKTVICHAAQFYAGLYYSISLNVCVWFVRILHSWTRKASKATWINSSTLLFSSIFQTDELMIDACWQSFIHFNLFSLFTLWWCVGLVVYFILYMSWIACECEWLSLATLLVKAPLGSGGGACRGAFLSPLLFRPCLPYFIFPLKKMHLHKSTSSHQSTDTLPSICLFLPRIP